MESASLSVAPGQQLGMPRERSDQRVIAWTALAAGAIIAVGGTLVDSQLLVVLGGAIIAALGAFLIPQLLLAAFLIAGGLKAAPFLAAVPVDLTVLTAAGVLAAMALRASKPDGIRPLPLATLLAIGLAALVGLSVIWSPAPDLGLNKALRFQTFTMIAFFAPFVLVRSREDLTRLMIFLVLASLLVAQTAVAGESPNQPLTVAGGESQIELALYSSSGVIAAIYLLLSITAPWRVVFLLPAVLLAQTVIAAGSRGVLIGTILALLIMGAMAVARSRMKLVPIAFIAAAVIAVVAFGAEVAGPAASAKYEGLVGGGASPETLGKRNFLVQDGIQLFLEYPMGRGASGYQHEVGFNYPHNALVEVAAEQGVIGLALLLGLIVAAFVSIRRAKDGPFSAEAILLTGLLVVLVADAMVSQTFTQFRELWFAMGLALAIPYIGSRRAAGDDG